MRIVDNTAYVKNSMSRQLAKGMVAVGITAEAYAKMLCPVDTGNLRNSITFSVKDGNTAVLGTNVEYAA